MILLFAAPPAAFADELPADAQAILDESGVDITDAAGWSLSDLCDTLGSWLAVGFQPALHFAAQAAGYLLLAGLLCSGCASGAISSNYRPVEDLMLIQTIGVDRAHGAESFHEAVASSPAVV